MRIRYGDRFEVHTDIEDEISQSMMLKLLLQPLVENSIVHGFHGLDRKGIIHIRGYKLGESHIGITIRDNGNGFDMEKELSTRKQGHETFNGIGLANVRSRIELQYGREGRLLVRSSAW